MAMTGQCGFENITPPLRFPYLRFLASLLRACHAPRVGTGTIASGDELSFPGEHDGDQHAAFRDCRPVRGGCRFERVCTGQLYPSRLLPAERLEQGMRLRFDAAMPRGQEGQQGYLLAQQYAAEPLNIKRRQALRRHSAAAPCAPGGRSRKYATSVALWAKPARPRQ